MLPDKDARDTSGDHIATGPILFSRKRVTGTGHLAKRSNLSRARFRRSRPREILIVDGKEADAERLTATLHVLFGYQISIRWARSLAEAIAGFAEDLPSLTFVDDTAEPPNDALVSMAELRRAGYCGPVVVVSNTLTQTRRTRLLAGGAVDVIHKDDLDSVRVAEAVDCACCADRA